MSGARFSGLSLAYLHGPSRRGSVTSRASRSRPAADPTLRSLVAVKVQLAPTSVKLRRVLPYFTPKSAGELIYTATPPPLKKAGTGGSPTLHLHFALASRKADGGEGYDESLSVVYTDGSELQVELDTLPTANDILLRIERKAKELKNKDEALAL